MCSTMGPCPRTAGDPALVAAVKQSGADGDQAGSGLLERLEA